MWNCLMTNINRLNWWEAYTGSGNGVVPAGTKPLPEPMLTQIYAVIYRHQATMSYRGTQQLEMENIYIEYQILHKAIHLIY